MRKSYRFITRGLVVVLALVMVAGLVFNIWTLTWQTYRNDEFGFSFKYPKDWYLNKEIVSKRDFDSGEFVHGDFGGFIFNIDPEKSVYVNNIYSPSLGDVEVSFYKKYPEEIQRLSRPADYEQRKKIRYGSRIGHTFRSLGFVDVYLETNGYVFGITMRSELMGNSVKRLEALYFHFVGSSIVDSFKFD